VSKAMETDGQWTGEWLNHRRDGSPFYVYARISAIKLGGHLHWICVQHDTTETRKTAEAFALSEERFRAVVETTPECVKIVREGGLLDYMNPAGRRMLGFGKEIRSKRVLDFVDPAFHEQWLANHRRVCSGESLSWQFI